MYFKANSMRVKSNYLAKYSMIFAFCCVVSFLWYWLSGRTFIWYYDGYGQHYKALIFYGSYLREVITCVFTGRFDLIPSWSHYIGEGGDILQTMHYYAIGDPLTVFSVFFNAKNMYLLYDVLGIVRLYLAGLAFAYFCKTVKVNTKTDTSIVMGSISYAFCLWAIYNTARHTFFVNPMIYLPLILAGVEKIIRKERSTVFILSVCLASLSNFYFFYMIALITAIYVCVLVICLYGKNIKAYLLPLGRITVGSICALLMSCIIFVPVAYAFLGDARAGFSHTANLFYPLEYYAKIPAMILSPTMEFWVCLNWVIPVFFGLFFLFKAKKEYKVIKLLFIISMFLLLTPVAGHVFNAMSYVSNRWCFALSFVTSFILTATWDSLIVQGKTFWRDNAIFSLLIILICVVIAPSRIPRALVTAVMFFIAALVLLYLSWKQYRKGIGYFMSLLVVLSISCTSFWLNSYGGDNYASESRRPSEIEEYECESELTAIDSVDNADSFYRYSGKDILRNAGLISKKSSIMYNWTLSNPNISEFNTNLGMMKYEINEYENYDDRTIPTVMSSVMYYAIPTEYGYVPYGFEAVSKYKENTLYKNQYPVSLTYSYSDVIPLDVWENMTAVQKQESILYGVVLDDNNSHSLNEADLSVLRNTSVDCELHCVNSGGLIDSNDKTITVDKGGAIFEITFDGIRNSENYLVLNGITYLDGTDAPIVIASPIGSKKTLTLYEDGYEYYNGRHDFVVNLGYSSEAINRIVVAFTTEGTYRFDSIEISCQPMDDYSDCIDVLNSDIVQNIDIQTDRITGDITLENTKAIVFAIPYSEGWTASVDGSEANIYRANDKYMALIIPSGHHEIVLEYSTPMFGTGCVLSLIGVVLFIGITCLEYVDKKRK